MNSVFIYFVVEQASSNRPASSPSRCCCAPATSPSCDMSEVYRRDDDCANETPACLITVTPKKEKPKDVPGPPPLKAPAAPVVKETKPKETPKVTQSKTVKARPKPREIKPKEPPKKTPVRTPVKPQPKPAAPEKKTVPPKKTPIRSRFVKKTQETTMTAKKSQPKPKSNKEEFEIADDATSLNDPEPNKNAKNEETKNGEDNKIGRISDLDPSSIITVNGKEELPCTDEIKNYHLQGNVYVVQEEVQKIVATETFTPPLETVKTIEINKNEAETKMVPTKVIDEDYNGNEGDDEGENPVSLGVVKRDIQGYCTLPRGRRGQNAPRPPRRTTPDGTDIYYWCDVPKKAPNGT